MKTEATVQHAISVDVEDWYQGAIDHSAEVTDQFVPSVRRILRAFEDAGVRGTFFVLGRAAEVAPHIVGEIAAAGHEIQSHGYAHQLTYDLTPEQFRQDLLRAKGLLEDQAGREVFGYRSPAWSIDRRNLWALDVLVETGHRYDSSIFPVKMPRYGIDGLEMGPHLLTTPGGARIVEAPPAVADLAGRRVPVAGAGYVRLWPRWFLRRCWRQITRNGRPSIAYTHPYEYDVDGMKPYLKQLTLERRLHQGLFRKGFPRKIDMLLKTFRFGTIEQMLRPLLDELDEPAAETAQVK